MATYAYVARRIDGTSVSGTLPAENERAALSALDRMGLFPLDLRASDEARAAPAAGPAASVATATATAAPAPAAAATEEGLAGLLRGLIPTAIGAETMSRFARELADLVAAGVPILRAIDTVSRPPADGGDVVWGAKEGKDDERARALLREVRRDVAQGASLAAALARQPDLLPGTSISLVKAGEAGGFLDQALRRVATFAEREVALKRKVKGALTYPALLATLSAGAVIFLLTWVVPRFAVLYADLGGALPLPTRILRSGGDLVRDRWWLLLLLAAGAVAGLAKLLGTESGRQALDEGLLRAPLIRRVIGQACVARFCRTLGTLLGSGVPILQSLEIAQGAVGNRGFAGRLQGTLSHVREGGGLAEPLRETRLFPPQVLEMVEVGQETGTLADVLERAGDRADEDVDHALRLLVAVLEPALVVCVAGVVFFVVVAALLPVFSLNQLVH